MFYVTLRVPRILRWHRHFCNICAPLPRGNPGYLDGPDYLRITLNEKNCHQFLSFEKVKRMKFLYVL